MVIIRIVGCVNGQPHPYNGKYVKDYDPTYHLPDGEYDGGILELTDNRAEAMRFSDPVEAMEKWRQPAGCHCHGVRDDGELNRPLTAWNAEMLVPPEIAAQVAKPIHQHDCTRCVFLGTLATGDFYCCPKDTGHDYILRYSSEGSDYFSACDFQHRQFIAANAKYETPSHYPLAQRVMFLRRMVALKLCAVGILNLMVPRGGE